MEISAWIAVLFVIADLVILYWMIEPINLPKMKFLTFLLKNPFYILYFFVMGVVWTAFAINPMQFINVPIAVYFMEIPAVVGGTIACSIHMGRAYHGWLSDQNIPPSNPS